MLIDKLCKSFGRITSFRMHFSTTTKVLIISAATSVALLGILASYLGRRKTRPSTNRRCRKLGGRRTRNSMRSPNDILSLAGSKASTNISPGGSVHAFSDRISLASGSLGAGNGTTPVTATQLGVMGMESLETVISYWEDALSAHALTGVALSKNAESEFCQEIQALLDIAYELQDKSELLFLDERSVLYRDDDRHSHKGLSKTHSDPNFDSAESFASALDQIADLREFEEFLEEFPNLDRYPLYQNTIKNMEEQPIPYRHLRTDMLNCLSDTEYLGKLHCIRLAFQYLFKDTNNSKWVADTGRQILTDLMCLGDKDPKDFLVGYESMLEFLHDQNNWYLIENELTLRNVKAMTFYDIVLDFIILDAFKDLDSPPNSVMAVIQNRFLTNGFKETALTTAVWSVLKAKRRLLKVQNGFMAHFYVISEQISPLMAWGFFGPNEHLKQICHYFRDEMLNFMSDMYSFQKCRYTNVEDLADDILGLMRSRVANISVKFNQ